MLSGTGRVLAGVLGGLRARAGQVARALRTGRRPDGASIRRRTVGMVASAARTLHAGQAGQSMVEYGIVVALIAIVAFATIQFLGRGIEEVFKSILDHVRTLPVAPGAGT